MAYEKTTWVDHVLDGEGNVVQQGTPVDAQHLNNLEEGVENSLSKDGGETINGPLTVAGEMKARHFSQDPSAYGVPNEVGQYLDMHVPGSANDYDVRLNVNENDKELYSNSNKLLHTGNLPTTPIVAQRYYSHEDNDETGFETWLNTIFNKMTNLSSIPIALHCYPAIAGGTYYGTLSRHTDEYATLVANTYMNDKTAHIHKVMQEGVWKKTKFLASEFTPQDIGAAPSGFGLGTYGRELSNVSDLNGITSNGWYMWGTSIPANAPGAYCTMFVAAMNLNQVTQIVYVQGEKNATVQRTRTSGVWSEWEYMSKKYGTEDLEAGVTPLRNGELYFVYE